VVAIDEGHLNFHTAAGRYAPFARLLERDGCVVRPQAGRFTAAALAGVRVLVIANALGDTGSWALPARPAFDGAEVAAVVKWVEEGGAVWLIADHMPFPGAAAPLADALGLTFVDGFALRREGGAGPIICRRGAGLAEHPITGGLGAARIDSVASFTGQAFWARRPVEPLMTLGSGIEVLAPERAWEFTDRTPRFSAEGLLQGCAFERGRGRVAVFGEAAMFSAQLGGPQRSPMGFNHPAAPQNAQFALNVLHWLARRE
jgi:hypothetical protein